VLVMTIGDKNSVGQRRCQGYEEQVGISLLLLRVLRISSRPFRFKIFIFLVTATIIPINQADQ
jgi:hypothetical protein